MSLRCLLGMHPWGGCKCYSCGAVRDKNHWWNNDNRGCKCTVCGAVRPRYQGIHTYRGCSCIVCGDNRDEHHAWHLDCTKCPGCGKKGYDQHDWSHDCEKCSRCAVTRHKQHDWSQDPEKCAVCGKQAESGTFIDNRDGHRYNWIRIRDHVIMAENLAFKPVTGNYWAVDDNKRSFDTNAAYGYQYDWETAMQVAPEGWHLPSRQEWDAVFREYEEFVMGTFYKENKPLHEDGRWYSMMAGWRDNRGNYIDSLHDCYLWSSTESREGFSLAAKIYPAFLDESLGARSGMIGIEKSYGLSVVLFRDH